jgi:hypothetical protein
MTTMLPSHESTTKKHFCGLKRNSPLDNNSFQVFTGKTPTTVGLLATLPLPHPIQKLFFKSMQRDFGKRNYLQKSKQNASTIQ